MDHKTASGTFTRCQRPATNRCTGCLGAPVYDEYVSKPTFYCSPGYQKTDWSQHKSEYRKLQARKTFGRAALLLQAFIYSIRLHASPLRFKSVRIEGSIIYLERFQFGGLDTQRQLKPFPVCLDGDRSLFEAVLAYMECVEAMMCLHSFAKHLLVGKSTLSFIFSTELDTDLLI
jgi:MYND finger